MTNKEIAIKQGYKVLTFKEMKDKLNALGYDINPQYVKRWSCSNVADGFGYYTTSCFFFGTNIGFANIKGKHISDSMSEENIKAFKNLRLDTLFTIGKDLYWI